MEGKLRFNDNERWEILRDTGGSLLLDESPYERYEITSGDVVEVQIGDHWIRTRVECSSEGYYACVPGIRFYRGMPARLPK